MQAHAFDATRTTFPIAILVKEASFNINDIERYYINYLMDRGIDRNEILIVGLPYNSNNKAPVKLKKPFLDSLMPLLNTHQVQHIFCTDSEYFKTLCKQQLAEKHMGYRLPCTWEDCEHMGVVLGLNFRALVHNPNQESKMLLGLKTFADVVLGQYISLGKGIIHSAKYPTTVAAIEQALNTLHQYPVLTADIEAFSLRFNEAGIGSISFAWNQNNGIAIPCDFFPTENGGEFVPNKTIRALLKKFLETYQGTLVWHNATYDLKVIIYTLWMDNLQDTNGLLTGLETLTERFHDTKIILYLATNSTQGNHLGLKAAAHEFAGNYAVDVTDIRKVMLDDLLEYNLVDALSTFYVLDTYFPKMQADQQEEIYNDIMLPTLKTLIQMELTGLPMNPATIDKAEIQLTQQVTEQMEAMHSSTYVQEVNRIIRQNEMDKANAKLKVKQHPLSKFSHVVFNPNSAQQKALLLYDVMGFDVLEFTKTRQPATGNKVLHNLITSTDSDDPRIPIVQALIDYGDADKIKSTFLPAFQRGILKKDGRKYLHGSFNLGGALSGRLSSSDPNLTNLPSGSVFGKLVKQCVEAPPGWLFVGADFASLEDRINALVTQDPNKLKVYSDGFDGHALRAANYWPNEFTDIDLNDPDSVNQIKHNDHPLRSKSKAPTFALTYGGTFHTLMKNCGFTKEEAQGIESNYRSLYRVAMDWVDARIQQACKDGYATSAFGLRIRTPLLKKTILGTKATTREAEAEGRSLGNAISGQSYGMLTNRSMNATMQRVWQSPYRFDILPVAMIHDANYFLVRANTAPLCFLNTTLIEEMAWQELPEIKHDIVKLEAELDVFYPTWADPLTLPNGASETDIYQLFQGHREKHQ